MLAKRIIPCLDIKDGRVVKGVRFVELADAGDPVELARRYEAEGADEVVFLDITATVEGRGATLAVVRAVAAELTIPFAVGGGVKTVDDVNALLARGLRQSQFELRSVAAARTHLCRGADFRQSVHRRRDRCARGGRLVRGGRRRRPHADRPGCDRMGARGASGWVPANCW